MSARLVMIAATVLAISSIAAAEPAKTPVRDSGQPAASRPAAVILASAEQAPAPAPAGDQAAPAPVKRPRAARVTTCRCGGQTEEQR